MPNDRDNTANVIIIGPRASGKTTIGRALALSLHRAFVDLDGETQRAFAECSSVSEAWSRYGEAAWRAAEREALARVIAKSGQVIALGGGTPMISVAFDDLMHARAHGTAEIIYLQCDVATLRNRLRHDGGDRPALRGSNPIDEVEQIVREREPVYTRLASVVIDAAPSSPKVVDAILKWLRARDAAAG